MRSGTRFVTTILALVALRHARPVQAQDAVLPDAAEGIHWLSDLDEAQRRSAADGKPVIAYFTFDTCHWCHKLEEDTFSDASVIELSRRFHWVKINRDVTPELCEQFNMSAYPSLITLGDNLEKIHRFSSYMLPDEFKPRLLDALRRYDLYKAGEEWDDPEPRPARFTSDESFTTEQFDAPSEEVPAGFALLNGSMWIAQNGTLFECELSGKVKRSLPIDNSVLDICTDGAVIYAMTGGWTAGLPIFVIDPATGRTLRSIVTESNKANKSYGAKGIAFVNGDLCVLEGMKGVIHSIDPGTGVITRTLQTQQRWLTGLAWDGTHYISGSKDHIYFFDENGSAVRSIAVNYPVRSVGWLAGADAAPDTLFAMEQPIFDYGKRHERLRLWPRKMVVYRLQSKGTPSANAEPLGSRANPIRCDMPSGERAYLNRLRCKDGSTPTFSRVGSYGAGPDGHVLDGYKVICSDGAETMIYLDMYHPGHVEREPVPGFTLSER